MEDGKIIPLKYQVEEEVDKPSTISIECIDADNQVNKEECPSYTTGTPKEVLIQAYETILTLES